MIATWFQSVIGNTVPVPTDPLWSSVTVLMGVGQSSVTNLKTGQAMTMGGNAALSPLHTAAGNVNSVLFPTNGTAFLSIPDVAANTFGTGDFTIEWSVYPVNVPTGSGYPIIPIVSWGGPKSTSPANFDVIYYQNNMTLTMNDYQSPISAAAPMPINTQLTGAMVRQSGMLSFYVNGTRVGNPVAYATNGAHVSSTPLYIGRRVGGGNGELTWNLNGFYSALRITKAARYSGTSYVVPTVFPSA